MKTVRLTMSDEVFDRLKREAKQKGYPGISSYALSALNGLTTDAEAVDIVKQARNKAMNWPHINKPFKLRNLFTKDLWEEFPKSARITAGRMFFDAVNEGIPGVADGGKNSANHQTYIRTE
jgi:hypothetical protein